MVNLDRDISINLLVIGRINMSGVVKINQEMMVRVMVSINYEVIYLYLALLGEQLKKQ